MSLNLHLQKIMKVLRLTADKKNSLLPQFENNIHFVGYVTNAKPEVEQDVYFSTISLGTCFRYRF